MASHSSVGWSWLHSLNVLCCAFQEDGRFAHFELVYCKCVDTYVRVKQNQNQVCWKFCKVRVDLVLCVVLGCICQACAGLHGVKPGAAPDA